MGVGVGVVGEVLALTNCITALHGASVFKKDYSWKTTFTLPVMKLQGDYSLFGRILLIPLNGRGQVFLDAGKKQLIQFLIALLMPPSG